MNNVSEILRAASFAAEAHAGQTRKESNPRPYIVHPLRVAELVADATDDGNDFYNRTVDIDAVVVALLHDVLEDTDRTAEDIAEEFGDNIALAVVELTDNKALTWQQRREQQIVAVQNISPRALLVRLADKVANMEDMVKHPPDDWDGKRRLEYRGFLAEVVDHIELRVQTHSKMLRLKHSILLYAFEDLVSRFWECAYEHPEV